MLVPNTKVRFKLSRVRHKLYMLSDNPNVSLKVLDCSLFTRRVLVAEPNHQYFQGNQEKEIGSIQLHGNYRKNLYHSISSKPIRENIFNNAPIGRVAVAMNTISAVAGSFHRNPFSYQQFHLRELRTIRVEEQLFH